MMLAAEIIKFKVFAVQKGNENWDILEQLNALVIINYNDYLIN